MKTIKIKGTIVADEDKWIYDWFGIDCTSPSTVYKGLEEADGTDVEIHINSVGGSLFAGSEIYTALKDYQGQVMVKVYSLAASAASVIAMAGDLVAISPTAQIMIHNVMVGARGDYRTMDHTSEVLQNLNKSIANAYRLKSGKEESELLKLMDKETWFNAKEALENGFADEIMFDESGQIAASAGLTTMLPAEVISKVRHLMAKENNEANDSENTNKEQQRQYAAKLNLLKLKGVFENE